MTREQIASMIASVGVPYAFDHFSEKDGEHPQGPPFICFLYTDRSDFHADGINYVHIVQLSIELYTDEPDFGLEAAVEAALTAADLTFQRPEQAFIEAERMYQTTYNTEVILSEDEPEPPGPEPEPIPPVPDPSDPSTLYPGQTVGADGWIVNSNGAASVYALIYEDDPQYQGQTFELTAKVNDHIEHMFVLFIPHPGPLPVPALYPITQGPGTYADGMTNVVFRFTVPDNATGCEIRTAYGGNGIKDIKLTRVS